MAVKASEVIKAAIGSISPQLSPGRNSFLLENGVEVVVTVPRPTVVEPEEPEDWWESSEEYWDDSGC